MPANVETMFSVRKPAWHGLGVVLDDYPGRDEAMRLAGHDWRVIEKPVLVPAYTVVNTDGTEDYGDLAPLEGYRALFHEKTGKVLQVATEHYGIVQNDVLWDIVDAIVHEPNVKYETAGVLLEGRVIWVLAKLDEPVQIPGDNSLIFPYVHVWAAHDGTAALRAEAVSVRVVCWNTWKAAQTQAENAGTYYSFRHSKNVMDKIEEARSALGLVRHEHAEFIELATELSKHKVTEDGVSEFLARFIPDPPADVTTERALSNIREARFKVYDLLGGDTIPDAHRRTAYGLFNAGIEYLDHLRAFRSPETYFKRTVRASLAKKQIAKLAMAVAE